MIEIVPISSNQRTRVVQSCSIAPPVNDTVYEFATSESRSGSAHVEKPTFFFSLAHNRQTTHLLGLSMMKYLKFLAAFLLFVSGPLALAADLNGYTAQYECRAGGPNCNVDVAALAQQSCQQVIMASTPWSSINWSNNVICIEAGDHTAKGPLTLGSSGTSGTRKILRYTRASDNDDEPWNQSSGNQVKIQRIDGGGQRYWIFHRLSFPSTQTTEKIYLKTSETNIIVSRVLVEGFYGSSEGAIIIDGSKDIVVQNSVIRNFPMTVNASPGAILFGGGSNVWLVNNEIYDVAKGAFVWETGSTLPGAIVENNDLYLTSAYYTNCAGNLNPSGNCSGSEGMFSTKSDGTQASPFKVIHNRMWGARPSDTHVCCDGGGASGGLAGSGGGASTGDWILFKDNILMDAEDGIGFVTLAGDGTNNASVIGNIIYKIKSYGHGGGGVSAYSYGGGSQRSHEVYLNTFVDVQNGGWMTTDSFNNSDVRCNVALFSKGTSGLGTGTQLDYNAYYGTADSGETHKLGAVVKTRTSATSYNVGDVLVTGPAQSCIKGSEETCFLYRVTQAGTTDSSSSAYCKALGCRQSDGSTNLQAIRGPYIFHRKLKTQPEPVAIPYVRVHSSAPENGACPSITQSGGLGAQPGVGISDGSI